MPLTVRRLLAEAFGTFGLVFIGASVVITTNFPGASFGLMGIALAHALVLSVMVSATMGISGGHLNPAVTVGLLIGRRINSRDAVSYIVAQLAGAVLAGLMVKLLIPSGAAKVTAYGAPAITGVYSFSQAIMMEATLTFFLVSAVYGTAVSKWAPRIGGFGIGLTLFFAILVGGPFTGAALNPARAFGPALMAGQWVGHAAYWIGPILGGLLAGLLWNYVLLNDGEPDTADA